MNMYKKLLVSLMSVVAVGAVQAAPAQTQVTIFARLFDGNRNTVSYNRFIVGVDRVARAKQFVSGEIFEGSVEAITFDTCTVKVKKMYREGAPYGGNMGVTKMYRITDQFQITLKKGQPQQVRLNGNQYLELTFEA